MTNETDDTACGNVLVIEGDAEYGRILSALLSGIGYEVRLATRREMASAALEQEIYDFIILDPSVYGKWTGQFLWTLAGSGSTMAAVIVISASTNIEEQARQLGAGRWLTKPVSPSDVLRAMTHISRLTAT